MKSDSAYLLLAILLLTSSCVIGAYWRVWTVTDTRHVLRSAFESRGLKCGIYTLRASTIAPSQAPQTAQRQIIVTPNPWEE